MEIFQETLIDRMKSFLDYAANRQGVISSNLANIDTPGYHAKELTFNDLFASELERPAVLLTHHPRHLFSDPESFQGAELREVETGSMGNDLNNVDLDREMTNLAVNTLQFSTVAQFIRMKLQLLDLSIRGG